MANFSGLEAFLIIAPYVSWGKERKCNEKILCGNLFLQLLLFLVFDPCNYEKKNMISYY